MAMILVGLSHHTAPVDVREQFSAKACELRNALEKLHIRNQSRAFAVGEAQLFEHIPALLHETLILSTCNRLEIYAVADDNVSSKISLEHVLARLQGIPIEHLSPYIYCLEGRAVVEHMMRVAAGLDSQVLGETQILGQVAKAFGEAQAATTIGPILSHLVTQALHAGKRTHTETAIGRQTISISHAAVLLAKAKVGNLRSARALVVGAGETATLAAEALHMHAAEAIRCVNRTDAHAKVLSELVRGQALPWRELPESLVWADVVITATSAPDPIIRVADVIKTLPQRNGRPLLFVDIALPRDVEEGVGDLPNITRYDIDDLEPVLEAGKAQWQAEAILEEETIRFLEWLHSRQVVPIIVDLRRKAEAIAKAEVEQALRRLNDLDNHSRQVVTRLAHRIVNKLLHAPTEHLKTHAINGDAATYAQVVQELFALSTSDERDILA